MRSILLGLFLITGSSVSSSEAVHQGQEMLNVLGFDAGLIDGKWGRKSKAAIVDFYNEYGGSFDGKLDENELEDLRKQINNGIYFKSDYVDYSIKYQFKDNWMNWEEYSRLTKVWANKNYFYENGNWNLNGRPHPHNSRCFAILYDKADPLYYHKHEGQNSYHGQDVAQCLQDNILHMIREVTQYGKDSERLNWFFEDFIPRATHNNYWVTGGFHEYSNWPTGVSRDYQIRQQNYNMAHARVFWYSALTYSWFKDLYGTTPELDKQFISWWEMHEKLQRPNILDEEFSHAGCIGSELIDYARNGKYNGKRANIELQTWNKLSNSCDNYAVSYAYPLITMGVAFQNSDYINEGLQLVSNVLRSASKDGVTHDEFRCTEGIGYPWITATKLSQIGAVLEAGTGLDLRKIRFEQSNTSVDTIMQHTFDISEDPRLAVNDSWLTCNIWYSAKKAGEIKDKSDLLRHPSYSKDYSGFYYYSAWWLRKTGQWNKYLDKVFDPHEYVHPSDTGFDDNIFVLSLKR